MASQQALAAIVMVVVEGEVDLGVVLDVDKDQSVAEEGDVVAVVEASHRGA
eukprot:m.70647 g.70647  ORF g.70647 m.70647 type:complete len:51 (+) comp14170_c2_seq2:163-315(+)